MEFCMSQKIKLRKNLNVDALFSLVRSGFKKIKDPRLNNIKISLSDALMSGFAMFSLKDPYEPLLSDFYRWYRLFLLC